MAALMALLLILAGELAIHALRDRVNWALFITVKDKAELLAEPEPDDIAIIGDSRLFHVRPAAVQQALGEDRRVRNYAWPLFGIEGFDYFLHAYLHEKGRPRAFLLSFMPNHIAQKPDTLFLQPDPVVTNRAYILLPTATLLPDLVRDERWWIVGDYIKFMATPPSMKYRDRIREHLRTLWSAHRFHAFDDEDKRRVREFREEGAFTIYKDFQFTPEIRKNFLELYGPLTNRGNEAVVKRMEQFLAETRELGIPVILMNGPLSESWQEIYEREGVLASYDQMVGRWQSEFPNVIVLEPKFQVLPDKYFGDPGHVNSHGEALHREFYQDLLRKNREAILDRMRQEPAPATDR
jgi:hypothetical protein